MIITSALSHSLLRQGRQLPVGLLPSPPVTVLLPARGQHGVRLRHALAVVVVVGGKVLVQLHGGLVLLVAYLGPQEEGKTFLNGGATVWPCLLAGVACWAS